MSDETRQDEVAGCMAASLERFSTETLAFWSLGIATGFLCQRCQTGCSPWLLLAAGAMIVAYVASFSWLLAAYATTIRKSTTDPWVRLCSIIAMGLASLFGLVVLSFVLPVVMSKFILYRLPMVGKYFNQMDVNDWLQDRTDASWIFVFVKMILVVMTFFVALFVAGMATFGEG